LIKKIIYLSAFIFTVLISCSDHHRSSIFKGEPMGFNHEHQNFFLPAKHLEQTFGNWRKISQYDDIIRQVSAGINWDWRLLASLICQESRFNPKVRSYRGAFGLMQIMPVTGENFGIDITSSPENNLKAGIRYINWLHSLFDPRIPDKKERINFILAAYNAGPGHVLDAMKLAEKNGMNPQKWEGNVALWLLKKSEPQYYNDTVVKNGYFRGTESVNFVSQVLERFEHYKNIIPEEKAHPF
jgi:membrane-bound lytic murein transglycosylase F